MIRSKTVPVLVLVLSLVAIAAVVLLQQRASDGRDAQLQLANLRTALTALQNAPFQANPKTGGSPARAFTAIEDGKREVARTLADLRRSSPAAALSDVDAPLRANFAALDKIYAVGVSGQGYGVKADRLATTAAQALGAVSTALAAASREYDRRASASDARATAGSAAAIVLLMLAFLVLYRRSARAREGAERLARENEHLAATNREEARTDALTGLGNRRALLDDLADQIPRADDGHRLALALFDLDGFKQYNDTFGHPAGDALLARLGERLRIAMAGIGTAYRMGGDEFCVLAPVGVDGGEEMLRIAAGALTATGEAFDVGCSHGLALLPSETLSIAGALRLADRRMYAHKAGRSSASRESTDVLLKVLSERNLALGENLGEVADLAALTAERLGLSGHDLWRVGLAAELRDVGKTAIPDAILKSAGPLDEDEFQFMRRHTAIGERILLAAPSLAPTAELVRSSHERFDGTGYPDGLSGDDIPLGSGIIAVCDAYDAMVSGRPYRQAIPVGEALEELRHFAGSQFDPRVVEAFCAMADEREKLLPA